MARLLITRPQEDAEPLAARLRELGHEVMIEPLLGIRFHDQPIPDLTGVQGLLFTSANGVRALARLTARRDLPAWTVGDASAAAAREAGFTRVESAAGDVTKLAALVTARCDPAAGALFHAAASVLAGDLSGLLEAAGFTVRRAVLYEACTATALTPACREALAAGTLDAILLFSPAPPVPLSGWCNRSNWRRCWRG